MEQNRIAWLIVKQQRNESTADERQHLNEWLAATPANQERFNLYTDPGFVRRELADFAKIDVKAAKRKVFQKIWTNENGDRPDFL
jgi:hypothetical protein